MICKTMRALILLTATIGLMQSGRLGAEPLPPRALTRIGDHRLYHGPGVGCAALSPDGRYIVSAANCWDIHSDKILLEDQPEYNRVIVIWDATSGERLRELRVRDLVSCLVFSPDGKCLSVACESYNLKSEVVVFAVETGKILRRLENFKNHISDLQFSPDGKQLRISEERGPVITWDAATGTRLHEWQPPPDEAVAGHNKKLCGLRGILSPDGKVIAWEMGYIDEAIRAYAWSTFGLRVQDAATNKLLYRQNTMPSQGLRHSAFSADGKWLAAYCGDRLIVWETATGQKRRAVEEPNGDCFALTPDGRHAVIFPADPIADENRAFFLNSWNLDSGKSTRALSLAFLNNWEREPVPRQQAFASDGKTLLLAFSPTLRLFDTKTGKERFRANHLTPVTPRFSTDGRTLFTSCVVRRCRWDVSGKVPRLVAEERKNTWEDGRLTYSLDDRLLVEVNERPICLRETATGRTVRELEIADTPNFGLFAPDAARILLGQVENQEERIGIYDVRTGKALGAIEPENPRGKPVFPANGRLIAWANHEGSIPLYDGVTGKSVRTLRSLMPMPDAEDRFCRLLFSPNGEQLIIAVCDTSADPAAQQPTRVFDVSSGREVARFYANPIKTNKAAEISCLACSPDSRLLAVAEKFSGTVRLIELASGKVRAEFAGHRHGVHGLDFAPDGKTLASGGEDNVVYLWDVTGEKTLPTTAENLPAWWNDLASEDGKRAGNAIASFLRKQEASVAFLQEKLRPEEETSEKRLAQLLADLDADSYEKREAASRELARLGERAEAALRRELTNRPTLEVRRRIEDVLSKLEPSPLPTEMLRTLRAIEILEHIGTATARRCLEALAKGAADARETREAKIVLQRLANRQRQLPGGANPQAHSVESR